MSNNKTIYLGAREVQIPSDSTGRNIRDIFGIPQDRAISIQDLNGSEYHQLGEGQRLPAGSNKFRVIVIPTFDEGGYSQD